jgi:hypothetical protein
VIQEAPLSQLATRDARDGECLADPPDPDPHPPQVVPALTRRTVTLWLIVGVWRLGLRRVESERVGEGRAA